MLGKLKNIFFFPVANYFKFFAQIRLKRWNPQIIVVTGSSGKTTILHLIESQLQDKAKYSYHANSAMGIPFDILGLSRKTLLPAEWILLLILAPFKAFQKPFSETIYVVEADADRPNEGKFLARLLHPDVTIWLNIGRTHSQNFEKLVSDLITIDKVIAYEFGYFLENTKSLSIINSDLDNYKLDKDSTEFIINGKNYKFKNLLPKEVFYSLQATFLLLDYLQAKPDKLFSKFQLPPGRSSILKGIKDTTIIDSSYNANLGSMTTLINLFKAYPAQKKWLVLGDKLAEAILSLNPDRVILLGKLVSTYTYPKLKSVFANTDELQAFSKLKDVLDYLLHHIKGNEAILFKASQSVMLDAVIEHLLQNKSDGDKLCRREKYWVIRRKQEGL
jgi:UDP-N-acetylmuramoyl-tripeptide--D-alanyl-D-alanine ligase